MKILNEESLLIYKKDKKEQWIPVGKNKIVNTICDNLIDDKKKKRYYANCDLVFRDYGRKKRLLFVKAFEEIKEELFPILVEFPEKYDIILEEEDI